MKLLLYLSIQVKVKGRKDLREECTKKKVISVGMGLSNVNITDHYSINNAFV